MTNELLMNLFCKGCEEIFAIPSRRGRPPAFCKNCGGDQDVVDKVQIAQNTTARQERLISAKDRVDNLEMLLKSRGNHISQHRAKWDNESRLG